MSDRRYEFLVAMHEVIEAFLCKTRGVTQQRVDAFDTGPGKDLDEPGDDPRAPYFHEHQFASKIEKLMAHELRVNLGCV